MKAKYILVSLLMVALVMGGTGYGVAAGSGDKVTGGGTFTQEVFIPPWFDLPPNPYGDYGDKISFGFNAQGQGDSAKGQFHLINHDSGMKAFGTVSEISVSGSAILIAGTCSIDGVPTDFWAELIDGGEGSSDDTVGIRFVDNDGPYDILGHLAKGNVQKHKDK